MLGGKASAAIEGRSKAIFLLCAYLYCQFFGLVFGVCLDCEKVSVWNENLNTEFWHAGLLLGNSRGELSGAAPLVGHRCRNAGKEPAGLFP